MSAHPPAGPRVHPPRLGAPSPPGPSAQAPPEAHHPPGPHPSTRRGRSRIDPAGDDVAEDERIAATVTLTLTRPLDEDARLDVLRACATLARDGLIQEQPRLARYEIAAPDVVTLQVVFLGRAALERWRALGDAGPLGALALPLALAREPETRIVGDVDLEAGPAGLCACPSFTALVLRGPEHSPDDGGLLCAGCGWPVPGMRIPLRGDLDRWMDQHFHVFQLWMASDALEPLAQRQLEDLDSELNRAGRAVVSALAARVAARVFYWPFVPFDARSRQCPGCGGEGEPAQAQELLFCSPCRIAYAPARSIHPRGAPAAPGGSA